MRTATRPSFIETVEDRTLLSAAVMSTYVPRELTPIYILVWRFILSYFTVAFGFFVFSAWVRKGLKGVGEAEPVVP